MRTKFIWILDRGLDATERLGIASVSAVHHRVRSRLVALTYKETGKRYCRHAFQERALVGWLLAKTPGQDCCPLCHKFGASVTVNRIRGRNGGKEDIEMRGEKKKEEEPPPYIAEAIRKHFYPVKEVPITVIVKKSKIWKSDRGVFAREHISEDTGIGMYTGEVLFTRRDMEARAPISDKVMEFEVWNNNLWIDAADSWEGIVNHKWMWPFLGTEIRPGVRGDLRLMLRSWKPFFANVDVRMDGTVYAISIPLEEGEEEQEEPEQEEEEMEEEEEEAEEAEEVPILPGDELSIDYGIEYWDDHGIRPYWDLRAAPNRLILRILTGPLQWQALGKLGSMSHLVLDEKWANLISPKTRRNFSIVFAPSDN